MLIEFCVLVACSWTFLNLVCPGVVESAFGDVDFGDFDHIR